jgi:hypothetical protein
LAAWTCTDVEAGGLLDMDPRHAILWQIIAVQQGG